MNIRELIRDRDKYKDWWHSSCNTVRRLETEIKRLEDQRLEALQEQVDYMRSIHPPTYLTMWARVTPSGAKSLALANSEEEAWSDITKSFTNKHIAATLELACNSPEMKKFAIEHGYTVVAVWVSQ